MSGFAQEPLGEISETQGIVLLKTPGARRWTPVTAGQDLYNLDWVRTESAGAHGARLKFASGAETILAPGTMVEISADAAELRYGEMQAPDGVFARQPNQPVEKRDAPSPELAGFGESLTKEALGSLIAKIDGRETPLAIGDHHVTVDIRDQIARTVIEESFINRTDETLEGVFYFPLPAGSSISGFGMWINDELIEADVVERERAREIYETILREKRDPGLLEWEGGNIFKARVYPIFPNGEKRIRIEYTQTLPARNGSYRYRYPLQSEMLRNNPLREISINVRVDSATPLDAVSCPTHEARIRTTENGAQAEFSAEKYVPGSDFELVVTPKFESSPLTVISHQRGTDGYFMALITPPGNAGWQRELVRDSDPLNLILLADTSASVSDEERKRQEEFITALRAALGPEDKVRIAAFDVDVHWGVDLTKRQSMGWSDFEKAFAEATERSSAGDHIIYIGDGIISKNAQTPAALVKNLAGKKGVTFHSIALGSEFEPVVMRGIAAKGDGGAMLRIEGSDTPASVAAELLRTMLDPGLRNIEVKMEGLRTAGVYPEKLTGIRDGQQAVIIGRYNPDKATEGEIVVTGSRGGKKETYRAPIRVANAGEGNSFIPRLWARYHLESLIASRDSKKNKKAIIALSERFKIMTPLTSFLVLDSEADRVRFGVERRMEMRDGEDFFAEGRERTTIDLARDRLKESGTWLRENRKKVIEELASEQHRKAANSNMELGFDWLLGGFSSGGTADDAYALAAKSPVPTGINPITSGLRSGGSAIASDAIDMLLNEVAFSPPGANRAFGAPAYDYSGAITSHNRSSMLSADTFSSPARSRNSMPFYPSYIRRSYLPSFPKDKSIPAAAHPAIQALLRWDKINTGVELTVNVEDGTTRAILSKSGWMVRTESKEDLPLKTWSHNKNTIILSERVGIASRRNATENDTQPWEFDLGDGGFAPLTPTGKLEVSAEKDGILTLASETERIVIDTKRNVLLRMEDLSYGLVSESLSFEDFVEVAGVWWAQKWISRDAAGKVTEQQTLTIKEIDAEAALERECKLPEDTLTFQHPLPDEGAARAAYADGKAGIEDLYVLYLISKQKRLLSELLEKIGNKPAGIWLELEHTGEEARAVKAFLDSPKAAGDLTLVHYFDDDDDLRPIYQRNGLDWEWRLDRADTIDKCDALVREFPRNPTVVKAALDEYSNSYPGIARALKLLSDNQTLDALSEQDLIDLIDIEYGDEGTQETSELVYHYLKANPKRITPVPEYLFAVFFFEGYKAAHAQALQWLDQVPTEKNPERIEGLLGSAFEYFEAFPGVVDDARLEKTAMWLLDHNAFDEAGEVCDFMDEDSPALRKVAAHAAKGKFTPDRANFLSLYADDFSLKDKAQQIEQALKDADTESEKAEWSLLLLSAKGWTSAKTWQMIAEETKAAQSVFRKILERDEWSPEMETIALEALPRLNMYDLQNFSKWAIDGRDSTTARIEIADKLRAFANRPSLDEKLVAELYFEAAFQRLKGKGEMTGALNDLFTLLDSQPDMSERLIKFLSHACVTLPAAEAKPLTERLLAWLEKAPLTQEWNERRYRLLLALGRTEELESALTKWVIPNDALSSWRRALAHLHASKGDLKMAIAQFTMIEKEFSDLELSDYQSLADWYLITEDKTGYRQAKANALTVKELLEKFADEEAETLAVLDLKTWESIDTQMLEAAYRNLKDPRLLKYWPRALLGKHPNDSTIQSIDSEAAVDAVFREIESLRKIKRAIAGLAKFPAEDFAKLCNLSVSSNEQIAKAHVDAVRRLYPATKGFENTYAYIEFLLENGQAKEGLSVLEKTMKEYAERKPEQLPAEWFDSILELAEWAFDKGKTKMALSLLSDERKRGWFGLADVELHMTTLTPKILSIEDLADRGGLGKRIRKMRIAALYNDLENETKKALAGGVPPYLRMAYLTVLMEAASTASEAEVKSVERSFISTFDTEMDAFAARDFAGFNEDMMDELSSAGLPVALKLIEITPDAFFRSEEWFVDASLLDDGVEELEELPDLEPRLWQAVERLIRLHLAGTDEIECDLWDRSPKDSFWQEKADAMADVAVSSPNASRALSFLLQDLEDKTRGIAFGLPQYKNGALDEEASRLLCIALITEDAGNAVAIGEDLIKKDAENPDNWAAYIRASDANGSSLKDLQKLLIEAEKHGGIGVLAEACAETKNLKPEAFGLFVRDVNGAKMSFPALAAKMRRYDVAVEISMEDGRYLMLSNLPDVFEFSDFLEAKVKRTGFDNPPLRKDLAGECLRREQPALAARHLAAALDLAPEDMALRTELIAALDLAKDEEAVLKVVLAGIGQPGVPLEWYGTAAKRFEDAGRKADAARALTSILEIRPGEEQAFSALARALQDLDRWEESVRHWRNAKEVAGTKIAANFGLAGALIHTGKLKEARGIIAILKKEKTLDSREQQALEKLIQESVEVK